MKALLAVVICAGCASDPAPGSPQSAVFDGGTPADGASKPPALDAGRDAPDARRNECDDGVRDCRDGEAIQCVAGAWETREVCEEPRPYCAGGRCIECLRGELKCEGTTWLACNEDGVWKVRATCAEPTPVCLEGRCVECEPGKGFCTRNVPTQCLADGTYAEQATCEPGKRCAFGECVADQPPRVTILEPANDSLFRVPTPTSRSVEIAVRGEALDPEDGNLVGTLARSTWSTDREDIQPFNARLLAYGVEARLSLYVSEPCEETPHRLALTVLDSALNQVVAVTTVRIGCYSPP